VAEWGDSSNRVDGRDEFGRTRSRETAQENGPGTQSRAGRAVPGFIERKQT
jgi:hypothetical protein